LTLGEAQKSVVNFLLSESLVLDKEFLQLFFIRFVPLQLCFNLLHVVDNIWVLEEVATFFVKELIGDDVFAFFVFVLVVVLDLLKYILDSCLFLYQIEGLHGTDSSDVVSVVAAAHNAKVDKFVHVHAKPFKYHFQVNLSYGFLLGIKSTEQIVSPESKRVHILGGSGESMTLTDDHSALGLSLARSFNYGCSKQLA